MFFRRDGRDFCVLSQDEKTTASDIVRIEWGGKERGHGHGAEGGSMYITSRWLSNSMALCRPLSVWRHCSPISQRYLT